MDTKIKARFWSDPEVECLDRDQKLALLWLFTAHISDCGYVECSTKRFEFETGSPWQALVSAAEALGGSIVRTSKGFLVRNYIREQIGEGERLAKNLMGKSIARSLHEVPAEVRALVFESYPELEALSKPFTSPCASSRSTGEERRGEERSHSGEEVQEKGVEPQPDLRFPQGFPKTADLAVQQLRNLALPDMPAEEWIREVWGQITGRGFRDAADVPIRSFIHHMNSRWTKEKQAWLAKRKMSGEKKEGGAERDDTLKVPVLPPASEEPDGWRVVWPEHFDFPPPERWLDVPASDRRNLIRWTAELQQANHSA